MDHVPTIHNEAQSADIARTVLMPGDPLRAKYVAETFLQSPRLVNGVRGMLGYTGWYDGKKVTVQGSGMGMPSIGLYSYELFHFYGVETIIRVGSTGALKAELPLNAIVIPIGASTDSNYQHQFGLPGFYAPTASFALLRQAVANAESMGISVTVGNIVTSDVFYFDGDEELFEWCKMGIIAVDMETAALYTNAARAGRQALSLLTVSDNLVTRQLMSPQDRERSFANMIRIALSLVG